MTVKKINSRLVFVLMFLCSFLYAAPNSNPNQEMAETHVVEQHKPAKNTDRELACVATAIYYESKNEPFLGQVAVARVIQNRIRANFASSACGVVYQKVNRRCQFTWACRTTHSLGATICPMCWQAAQAVFQDGAYQTLVPNALYFREINVRSRPRKFVLVTRIGHHNFFQTGTIKIESTSMESDDEILPYTVAEK